MRLIKYYSFDKENKKMFDGTGANRFIFDEISHCNILSGKTISIFGTFFYLYWDKHLFWFRFLGGYGLHGQKDNKKRFVLFSERMGLVKKYKVFGWVFKILKP